MSTLQHAIKERHVVVDPARERKGYKQQQQDLQRRHPGLNKPYFTRESLPSISSIVTGGSGTPKSLKIASNLGTMK